MIPRARLLERGSTLIWDQKLTLALISSAEECGQELRFCWEKIEKKNPLAELQDRINTKITHKTYR